MKESTATFLRTTTSIGDNFLDQVTYLKGMDDSPIDGATVNDVEKVVLRLRKLARENGYLGGRH